MNRTNYILITLAMLLFAGTCWAGEDLGQAVKQPVNWTAISMFAAFASVVLLDGVLARRLGKETAARRIADVIIDRAAIHLAVLATAIVNQFPMWLPILMLSRDLAQAAYSAHLVRTCQRVVVGPHSHMFYGLSMLAWGSYSILTHELNPALTGVTMLISSVVLVDYFRRCAQVSASIRM